MTDQYTEVAIDLIDDPENPMRSDVRDDSLWELADNIKQNGLINPITIRPRGDRFEVVAGHRRLSACRIAALGKVRCVIRDLDDKTAFSVMAAENLERQDVDIVDESTFIREYMARTESDIPETARALRRSVRFVEDRVAVGNMPDYMQAYLKSGQLKLGAALALAAIDYEPIRRQWTDEGAVNNISVRLAEYQRDDFFARRPVYVNAVESALGSDSTAAPTVITFRDEYDGEEYNIKTQRLIAIAEDNYATVMEAFRIIRESQPHTDSGPGGVEDEAPSVDGAGDQGSGQGPQRSEVPAPQAPVGA